VMDPITAVQTAEAVQGLLGGVVKLAKKILQARREVKHLPKDIDELLEEIAALEPVTDSTEAGSSDQSNEFLKPRLEKLQEELERASNQLEYFKESQEQDKSSTFAKVAKATVNRGAGKRHREIRSIRETIQGLRVKNWTRRCTQART
jgi:predicted  nucleic acid-binding Zn-ribbon protein